MKAPKMSLRKRWSSLLALPCLALAAIAPPVSAESAGSVEAGLTQLAKQIVEKSVAADRKTIAVLPFPNADGSCSVLSTYLVDELILGLFGVPNSPVTIIERSQLEALISEMSIGEGGLLNPETTQKLGNISGVQALTVGTITVIGDSVRVNARLVNTASAQTISAPGVTLPRTSAVTQLLTQPLSRDVACGSNMGRAASAGSASPVSTAAGAMVSAVPVVSPGAAASYKADSVTIQLNNILPGADGQYKVIGIATNNSEEPVKVMWLAPMMMLDQMGTEMPAMSSTGIAACIYNREWVKQARSCYNYDTDYTVLTPGLPRNFVITFGDPKRKTKIGSQVALTGRVFVQGRESKELSINFPGLLIPEK